MIDTIALVLLEHMFYINDHNLFSPSSIGLYSSPYYTFGSKGYIVCTQNPTSKYLKQGIYKPRLSLTKRFRKGKLPIMLKIEFSIPKLLYNNNFDEVTDGSITKTLSRLKDILLTMGVVTTTSNLADASISLIHYSKNIILTDGSTPKMYLDLLHKADINLRLDTNQTDYRNEGHSFKYHTNAHEITLYDKLIDLQRAKISDKRAEETDSPIQLDLLDTIEQIKRQTQKPFEVLRMEVRLNRKTKILSILKKLKLSEIVRFTDLFSSRTSQAILQYFLNDLIKRIPVAAYSNQNPEQFIATFRIKNPHATFNEIAQAYGHSQLVKQLGVRQLRASLDRNNYPKWYRYKTKMDSYKYPAPSYNPMKELSRQLAEFKPVKSFDFPELMINNDKYD